MSVKIVIGTDTPGPGCGSGVISYPAALTQRWSLDPVAPGAQAGEVRTRDVAVGGTYLVEVPHDLPPGRYPVDVDSAESAAAWLRLNMLRGARFPLTVTSVDTSGSRPTAQGLRTLFWSHARVALTLEQALELGLPPGAYEIAGQVSTPDGEPIELPHVEELTVPVRWLRPLDAPQRPTHRDITGKYF